MRVIKQTLAWVLIVILFVPNPTWPQEASTPFQAEELDQLVAPIALHPDSLLVQVLMASTYPLEVVEAARYVKQNPNLKGDQLNDGLKQKSWDDSVKSLVFFPQVLTMMNEKLDWLQKLGDAFLAQQQDLMAAIQRLRARAQAAGQLKTTPEQNIIVEPAIVPEVPSPPPAGGAAPAPPPTVQQLPAQTPPTVIRIEPTNPQVVHVPSYDPTVVYGAWPPAYPPYYPYPPGYFAAGAFTFFAGAAVGAALWGGANWNNGDVNINNSNANNFTRNTNNSSEARNRVEQRQSGAGGGGQRGEWKHNAEHRKGVQYRDKGTQQRFDRSGPGNAQSREAFRGRTGQGSGPGQGGGLGQGRPTAQPAGGLGERGGQASRAGGFEGMGSGRDASSFSSRGNASRESFNRSAGSGSGSRSSFSGGGGGARAGGGGGGGGGGGRSGGGGGGGGGRGGGRR